jgi:anaerobic magnesium-protoporphyrin IX monomethyl ester cyclase
MDKGIRIEQIYEARRLLAAAGIQAGFFLQFGYPGESLDDIQMTLRLVRQADPDDIGMSVSYPLPGTRFHEAVRQQMGNLKNWRDSEDLAMLYRGPFSTRFYRRLHTVLHREFRLRKAWKSRRQRPSLRQAARLLYYLLSLPLARLQLRALALPNRELPALQHLPRAAASTPSEQVES